MKLKHIVTLQIIILVLLITSCEMFTERDISDQQVKLISPPEGLHTTISTQTFWWDMVDNAENYHLQIVSPGFNYIERLIADTLLTDNKFVYTLLPGTYQWRVAAYNNSSQTPYTVFSLIIDSTPDISGQIIMLLEPKNNDTTNKTDFTFKWELLYNADNYNFQLYYENEMYLSINWQYDTLSMMLEKGDGNYLWKVRGQNAFSNTAYSSRSIYLDTSPPNKPLLTEPHYGAELPDTIITLSWDRGSVNGSSIKDSLYVYSDQSLGDLVLARYLSSTTFSDSLGPGNFYWRIRSIDAAGNKSDYSELGYFIIKQ